MGCSGLVHFFADRMQSSPDGSKNMSDKAKVDLPARYFEQGHRMASEAETGSFEAVNKELATLRSQIKPAEYNALIRSIQSANIAHVAEDQQRNSKDPSKLRVPTLILEDSPKDKDKLPDHIGGRVLHNGPRQAEQTPTPRTQPGQAADGRETVAERMRRTGNYPMPWSEAAADAAWKDVLYPNRKTEKKGN